eukprot:2449954-Pyramimonas_sp.AAC.1
MAEEVDPRTRPLKAASQAIRAMWKLSARQVPRSTPITLSQEIWIYLLGGGLITVLILLAGERQA